MYESYFGLSKPPFGMTPDPGFLFQTPTHREALSALLYGVFEHKGCIVVTGDAGTGKTTLLSRMLRIIPSNKASFSLVLNPALSADDFLESVLVDFGIDEIPSGKVRRLLSLQQFLLSECRDGKICVLVADEAQKLSRDVLEEIRLLTNFENAEQKLLQVILAGQPELRNTLNAKELRQLKQRVAVRCQLQPLSHGDVAQYIQFRWAKAGGIDGAPFDKDAIQNIADASGGIPRVVNALCDNALILIFASGEPAVTAAHVQQVTRDLDLGEADSHAAGLELETAPGANGGAPRHPHLNLPCPEPVKPARSARGFRVRIRIRR